jgi:hypothetical protein
MMEEVSMALEFIVVQYPEKREVFIDGQLYGLTNITLYIQSGTHQIHLGVPKDYRPGEIVQAIQNTSPLEPAAIVFEKVNA